MLLRLAVLTLFCLLFGYLGNPLYAQTLDLEDLESEEPSFQWMPPSYKGETIIVLPRASYSDIRGFGLGGSLQVRLGQRSPLCQESTLRFKVRKTVQGQTRIEGVLTVDFADGRYNMRSKFQFDDLAQRYYGIGPGTPIENEEIYRPRKKRAYIELFRRVSPEFKVGARTEYEHTRLLSVESGGLLEVDPPEGTEGGDVYGLGFVVDYNNRVSPYQSGIHYQGFAMYFDARYGNEFDFNVFNLDFRNYFATSDRSVFATQLFYYGTAQQPPLWRMAALGGREHTRGYRTGRNLDRNLLAAQGEYRFHAWKRVGLAFFAGVGNVAPELENFRLEDMQVSVGAGIRFSGGAEETVIRFDVAYGDEVNFYFKLGEPF
ncbi:MAG: hypothetical protein HKN21_16490 [Candidatus Eisenbacteria bacterium]|uniref:Bacterial surface antigen (D15) domain-containing protein n=1 Tax=Eiseniibacteriota bacterium TaxID=2212470 RepID=A0A7Y2H3S1_UNCEI|nr:hypothetical protein [Candidatus Eisenbacteria bacterium]